MAHPDYLRQKARKLRTEQGLTLDELVERLALPKTTIYYWVRDIPLPPGKRSTLGQRLGSEAMQRKYRLLREAAYAEGEREFEARRHRAAAQVQQRQPERAELALAPRRPHAGIQ